MRIPRLTPTITAFLLVLAAPSTSIAQVSVQITIGPPPIPVYEQPLCPGDGYIWTPGYWAWGYDGYFWVPGTWVESPEVGMLWTPGYWGWDGAVFIFHTGYWGPHIGFYGGINYGYGYNGYGFDGGYWRGSTYYYNRSVTNVNTSTVTNVYNRAETASNTTRIAYNGGPGGLRAAPTPQERAAERDHHIRPTSDQIRQHDAASHDKNLLASVNRGKPPVAATMRPADFSSRSVVAARAPGGHVDERALKATPKKLETLARNPAAETRPARPAAPRPAPEPRETMHRPVPRPVPRPEMPAPRFAPERHQAPEPPRIQAPGREPMPERRPAPHPAPAPRERPEAPREREDHARR